LESISIDEVTASASAQRIVATEAARGQIRDTLFALGARARGLDDTPAVRVAVRAELGRAVLEALRDEAAKRPPTDAEVAEATAVHYVELDRPAAFRVIHTALLLPRNADPATRALARTAAEQVSRAVASATTPDAFRSAASSVPHEGLECKTEELAPIAEDGRKVDLRNPAARGSVVPEFARAAARLQSEGQKSGVIETSYGYHVMMLIERIPALVVPLEERRARLAPEIIAHRAQDGTDALVRELRAQAPPSIERSADTRIRTLADGPR
jgi:peptidyl-prolyl cis-trans isomerase C